MLTLSLPSPHLSTPTTTTTATATAPSDGPGREVVQAITARHMQVAARRPAALAAAVIAHTASTTAAALFVAPMPEPVSPESSGHEVSAFLTEMADQGICVMNDASMSVVLSVRTADADGSIDATVARVRDQGLGLQGLNTLSAVGGLGGGLSSMLHGTSIIEENVDNVAAEVVADGGDGGWSEGEGKEEQPAVAAAVTVTSKPGTPHLRGFFDSKDQVDLVRGGLNPLEDYSHVQHGSSYAHGSRSGVLGMMGVSGGAEPSATPTACDSITIPVPITESEEWGLGGIEDVNAAIRRGVRMSSGSDEFTGMGTDHGYGNGTFTEILHTPHSSALAAALANVAAAKGRSHGNGHGHEYGHWEARGHGHVHARPASSHLPTRASQPPPSVIHFGGVLPEPATGLLYEPGAAALTPMPRPKSGVYPTAEVQREGIYTRFFTSSAPREQLVSKLTRLRPLSADTHLSIDPRVARLANSIENIVEDLPYSPCSRRGRHLR